jgi:hypothetical protein
LASAQVTGVGIVGSQKLPQAPRRFTAGPAAGRDLIGSGPAKPQP